MSLLDFIGELNREAEMTAETLAGEHSKSAPEDHPSLVSQHITTICAHRMLEQCLFDTCDGKLAQIGLDTWRCQTCGGQWRLVGPDPGFDVKPAARPVPPQNRNLTVSEFPAQCPACEGAVNSQDKVTAWCPTCRVFILLETIQ